MTRRAAYALGLAAAAAVGGPAAAGGVEKPLPVDRTQILKGDGAVYYVEGRVRIPKGIRITVPKDAKVLAHGDGAVIEVEGELEVRGVSGDLVPVENVRIEVQAKFDQVRLQMVDLRGKAAGIASPKETPVEGRIYLEGTAVQAGATIDLTMQGGGLDIRRSAANGEIRLKAVDPPGATTHSVQLNVSECANLSHGLDGGLYLEGVSDVTLRMSRFTGEKVSIVNCGNVNLDADYFCVKLLEFVAPRAGQFKQTKITKCDFQCEQIAFKAPPVETIPETVRVENCWFDGVTSVRAVRERFIWDHDDSASTGVLAEVTRIAPNPLLAAGPVRR